MSDVIIEILKAMWYVASTIIIIFLSITFCIFLWNTTITRWACDDFEAITGLKSQFSVTAGCYITLDTGEILNLHIAQKVRSQKYDLMYNEKY